MTQTDLANARHRAVAGLLLLAVLLIDLLVMPGKLYQSDAIYWRMEAYNLLQTGRLGIGRDTVSHLASPGEFFVRNPHDGLYYCKFGIMNTGMSMPPMIVERFVTGKWPSPLTPNVLILNLWNILLNLLLAWVLYIIAGRYAANPWRRAAYVMACLFATYLWFYQRAQESELYHALFFALAYESLLRGLQHPRAPRGGWLCMAWVFIGFLVLARLFDGILIGWILLACYLAIRTRRKSLRPVLPALIIPPIVILAMVAWINDAKFGSPFLSGYHQWRPEDHLPTESWLVGLWGLLFTAHWSIFAYFPLLFLALPGARRFSAQHPLDASLIFSAFALTLVILAKIPTWRGEWDYGARYLIFLMPIAGLPALYFGQGWSWRLGSPGSRAIAAAAILGLGYSLWLQVVMIRAGFWFFYEVQAPLDHHMTREVSEYLFDRHEAMLFWDLYSHRDDLDATFLFRRLHDDRHMPAESIEIYRRVVLTALEQQDLYWWPTTTAAESPSSP